MSIRKKIWLSFAGILILVIFCGLIDWPRIGWPGFSWFTEKKVHLGLDLQGGTHLLYECDLSKVDPENYDDAVAGVRDVIERRVNALGLAEPLVQTNKTEGHWRLIIELPGVANVEQAVAMIGQTPTLDFRELVEIPGQGQEQDKTIPSEEPKKESKVDFSQLFISKAQAQENIPKVEEQPKDQSQSPEKQPESQPQDAQTIQTMFVPTKLGGQHLKRAELQFDQQTGQPQIGLEFDSEGTKLFAEITEKNVGKPVAIFLDDNLISAPRVQEAIREGKAVITGQFTMKEAKELAMRLNAGALPVPVNLVSEQNVGASLGKISVEKSFLAGVLGVICVALFMIIYYRLPGLLSVFALIIYGLIVLALYKLIPVILTLSGVAGFIISIGMAVDANVLIFEGMKEGLRAGKPLGSTIDEGFKYAWGAIRDSNITTLITCAILAWFGTSMVKGFAITLGIGILVSMFSAIVITRTFLKLIYAKHYSKA
jgi:protein-export membrane protein SecD